VSDSNLALEDLLQRRLPSAVARDDASLASVGIANADLAGVKDAVAALGLTASPAAPPPAVRERLLASRLRQGRFGIFADRVARMFDLPIAEAEGLMKRIEDPAAWNPFLVDGVEMIPVAAGPACANAIATLVRIQPGKSFPEHTHVGDETMLVLDGGFNEPADGGEEVWRGDEIFRGEETGHMLVALPGVPCVAAVVIFGHADFK
jgi:quercetin dioxygenase-like cupin family protein